MKTMNQSQFAKHLGVAKSYITQLKQAGRLVIADDGRVDVEASILRIKETADPVRDDVIARHAAERGADTAINTKSGKKTPDEREIKFADGRAKEQHFKALQAELEYNKSIGNLVSREDMAAAVADVVTDFRQAIENMPHRIAADLVGKDMDYIRATLKQEANNVLADLAKGFAEKIEQREVQV